MSLETGFYGKLPSLGDFASRRLQKDFIISWDGWLQSSLAASQEVLGEQWLKYYLISPIWRFALSPGLCGKDAWLGIVMPSVDRVGRYFPLTIASKVNANTSLIHSFSQASNWFEELETAAIEALENNLAIETFDEMVRNIAPCESIIKNTNLKHFDNQSMEKSTIYLGFEHSDMSIEQMFPDITSQLLATYLPGHSLWCTTGSEEINPAFLVVNGLPHATTYVGMIMGQFQQTDVVVTQPIIPQTSEPSENRILDDHNVINKEDINDITPVNNNLINTVDINDINTVDTGDINSVDINDINAVDINDINQVDNNVATNVQELSSNAISSTPEQRAMQVAWESFSRTDTGKVRKLNEDSILDRPDLGLWVVADGMGGHQAGDVASRKIINTLNELNFSNSLDLAITEVKAALQLVNNELKELAARMDGHQIVGSTVVTLIAGESHFAYLWAGDSRLYRLRDKQLLQLTIDHCSEQEEITDVLNLGSTTELKQNNIITRAVGAYEELELDNQIVEVQSGDIFLLSSDGLDKELSFQQIEQVLIENKCSQCVDILLEQVLTLGARDNVSIIVVEIK